MTVSHDWYMKDVFRWRTGASIAWSLLLLPVTVSLYVCLAHLSILHPTHWLLGWLQTCVSLSTIACTICILLCTVLVSVFNALSYSVVPQIHRNRLSIILSVTRPTRLLHALSHTLLGGVIAWACSKLIGGRYVGLSVQCNSHDRALCLNEHHLFLVLYGAFLGAVYSVSHFIHRSNLLTFDIIQQVKFFQVKSNVFPSVVYNTAWALRLCAYFYVFYYLLGCLLKSWLLSNLHLQELSTPVDSIRGLLDIRLLWQVWLLGTLITHAWKTSLYLFKVFNTEVYEFPIETPFSNNPELTLHRALAQRGNTLGLQGNTHGKRVNPLVQYLAYHDLSLLAEHSSDRRKLIFSLSQPGGHPHNWNNISSECLALIASLTDRLITHQERAANGFSREKRLLEDGKKPSSSSKPRGSASPHPASVSRQPHHLLLLQPRLASLRQLPLCRYLVDPFPETDNRALFIDTQLHIWALEALSSLAAASFNEDSFGVVQKSLPDILTEMLGLHNALEKLHKLPNLMTPHDPRELKVTRIGPAHPDDQLRNDLRTTVKTSLHRIIATFGQHIKSVPLATEYRKQLIDLMEYRL